MTEQLSAGIAQLLLNHWPVIFGGIGILIVTLCVILLIAFSRIRNLEIKVTTIESQFNVNANSTTKIGSNGGNTFTANDNNSSTINQGVNR